MCTKTHSHLCQFMCAQIMIRAEAKEICEGKIDKNNNPLKHAPHSAEVVSVFSSICADLCHTNLT